ncbi:MAG: transport protein RbsD/FucU [Micrococcales bacterium 70-64]|nr:transport protein RbsD/FucU [Leifsonia sp.]ODU63403.1 MAG: transport protein RbsD/FucU [Leifsonia sp. SCN 70-46]OJX85094.1 MAG: transport protein RbsD/FucU [Micrococcales bacterium 70-64]
MLSGVHPLLTGELLLRLDQMGHSDAVVVSDAHFPARAAGQHALVLPGVGAPELVAAIRSVLPLDSGIAVDLMRTPDGLTALQHEMLIAAGVGPEGAAELERAEFYARADAAFLAVRTGETRPFGNIILRKGLVTY